MRSQCSGLLCPAYTHSCMFVTSCCSVTFNRWLAPCHRKTLHIMFSGQMPHMEGSEGLGAEWLFNALPIHAKASAAHCYRKKKKKKKREKEKIVGGGRTREEMVRSYLTVTSSVNLSTRCVRMLRGMELPPSILWGGLFFRHAGRVELCVRAPPTRGGERTTCKERQRKTKMTHAADRSKQRHSR